MAKRAHNKARRPTELLYSKTGIICMSILVMLSTRFAVEYCGDSSLVTVTLGVSSAYLIIIISYHSKASRYLQSGQAL